MSLRGIILILSILLSFLLMIWSPIEYLVFVTIGAIIIFTSGDKDDLTIE